MQVAKADENASRVHLQAIRNALTDAEVTATNAQVEIATRRQELASTLTAANQAILDFQAQSAPFMSGMG